MTATPERSSEQVEQAARHETRALLRAHLAASAGRGHLTRHCPVCHRLLRLAMEPHDTGRTSETRDAG